MKKCPWCAEAVQDDALICRYCQRDLRHSPPDVASADPVVGTAQYAQQKAATAWKAVLAVVGLGLFGLVFVAVLGHLADQASSGAAGARPAAGPGTAARVPAAARGQALEVVEITTRATESNDSWTRYAWRLTVRNATDALRTFRAEVEWQDGDGFVIDTDREYNLQIGPQQTQTFTGDSLITQPAASRVATVTAKITGR